MGKGLKKNSKGLSTIVITLLLIFVVVIAVIWVVVGRGHNSSDELVNLWEHTLDLEIKEVKVLSNETIQVRVKRNQGEGEFVAINFIFDDGTNLEVIKQNITLDESQEKFFYLNLVEVNVFNIQKIKIAPVFKLKFGKEVVGPVKDEYIVSGGILVSVCDDTCESLGYECGTTIICEESVDCGEGQTCEEIYGSGYVCSKGICVEEEQEPECGDKSIGTGEQCDDGNTHGGDGCSSDCLLELGWACYGEPSICIEMFPSKSADCEGEECLVLLVIEKTINEDEEIRNLINLYKLDNGEFEFEEIIFEKFDQQITNMNDVGGEIKKNSLELRNTIKEKYNSNNSLIGVFLIGDITPMIYRDSAIWRDLGLSGFYPSVYPLVALDDEYYRDFDELNDGFYEFDGMTTGSEIGGGYNASIWVAILPFSLNNYEKEKNNLINYFIRNHQYRLNPFIIENDFLYASTHGCSNYLMEKRFIGSLWNNNDVAFVCPNTQIELEGFNSKYNLMIHNKGEDFVPTGSSGSIFTSGEEELNELNNWVEQDYFGDSDLRKIGDEKGYFFSLNMQGRSIPLNQIKETIENNFPPLICGRYEGGGQNCFVYVMDTGFVEKDVDSFGGYWSTYQDKQDDFDNLLKGFFEEGVQYTYMNVHGGITSHQFATTHQTIENNNFNSLIYQIESCNTGNYLYDNNIAKAYLYSGEALVVSAYSIPFVNIGFNGYYESDANLRFLDIESNKPLVEYLFLKNYGNNIYFGDPLLFI